MGIYNVFKSKYDTTSCKTNHREPRHGWCLGQSQDSTASGQPRRFGPGDANIVNPKHDTAHVRPTTGSNDTADFRPILDHRAAPSQDNRFVLATRTFMLKFANSMLQHGGPLKTGQSQHSPMAGQTAGGRLRVQWRGVAPELVLVCGNRTALATRTLTLKFANTAIDCTTLLFHGNRVVGATKTH